MDATAFYNGAYFLTDEDLKKIFDSSSGVLITGSGYIAYDLQSLQSKLTGGLKNKIIEI